MDNYQPMAERISRSKYTVALTGAGISVESGIPDFRGSGGLWSRYDPLEFGYIESFRANPAKVWKMLVELDEMLLSANPNPAHLALAEMERRGILRAVITQNVDSLHQRAGSMKVVEFHGNNRTLRCDSCGKRFQRESVSFKILPPLCLCGTALRPDLVFFGEIIPSDAYREAVVMMEKCDFMLIIGTSASVSPASYLPRVAKQHGAYLVEINPKASELSYQLANYRIAEQAGIALPAILAALDNMDTFRNHE
jgi:NAD-dependent deacetylase